MDVNLDTATAPFGYVRVCRATVPTLARLPPSIGNIRHPLPRLSVQECPLRGKPYLSGKNLGHDGTLPKRRVRCGNRAADIEAVCTTAGVRR